MVGVEEVLDMVALMVNPLNLFLIRGISYGNRGGSGINSGGSSGYYFGGGGGAGSRGFDGLYQLRDLYPKNPTPF